MYVIPDLDHLAVISWIPLPVLGSLAEQSFLCPGSSSCLLWNKTSINKVPVKGLALRLPNIQIHIVFPK